MRPRRRSSSSTRPRGGELYPPADHPLVLTVGDSPPASSVGPTADGRTKPDAVLEDSRAFFSDGQVTSGSSNAAAYLTGVVAVMKAAEPRLRTRHLLLLARQGKLLPQPAPGATATTGARPPQAIPPPGTRAVQGSTNLPAAASRSPSYAAPSVSPARSTRATQ